VTTNLAARIRRWSAAVINFRASEDERAQAARLGALLFGAGGGLGVVLIPILPPSIDRPLAYFISTSSLVCGLLVRVLPWERWSRSTLHVLCPIGLALITLGGGFVGGSLDYYSLFLPLIFIFAGSVFLPRTSVWLGALGCGLFALSLFGAQHTRVAPFFILSLVLAVVCGLILAQGRQTERRTLASMRHLLDAATALGTAANADGVGLILSPILIRLVDAEAAAVSLFQNGMTVVVGSPLEPGARLRMEALADRATRLSRIVVDAATEVPAAIAVPIPGRDGTLGALITVFGPGQPPADRFSQGMIKLLAAESGRVLDRLSDTASLTELAMTDPLTGLANRTVLDRVLSGMQPGDAVVLCDLDHFKAINDTFGHAAGDRVLVSFAACLSDVARENDTAARFGGEEFSLVLPGSGIDGARQVVARLRETWAHQSNPRTTFSAGIAVNMFGEIGDRTAERADLALYRAKAGGRDRDELADDAFRVIRRA
jgi:diguanylate cyclase (GGDEF)-like protein